MKFLRLPLFVALFVTAASSVLAQGAVLYSWDFSKTSGGSGYASVPPLVGDLAINFQNGAGVADDPNEGRKVLTLDGTQTEPGRTNRNINPLESVMVRVRFKPTTTGAPLQTIVVLGGIYEIRYDRDRSSVEFIVNSPPDKKYYIIRADVSADVWNQATATFKDGKLTLAVGTARKEGVLPPDLKPVSIPTSVRVGLVGPRPYSGSISELVISEF
jgi:hypothetical protein